MFVMGNLIWDAGGPVSALFGVPERGGNPAALLPVLATLRRPSMLSTVGPAGAGSPGGPRWMLSVEVRGAGVALPASLLAGAASASHLRPLGLASSCPAPRPTAGHRAAASRVAAGLAAFRLTEPSAAEVCSALGDGEQCWREIRCCGYAAGGSDGCPSYRACLVALPLGGAVTGVEWPLDVSRLPAAGWSICVRASRDGTRAALLARIVAADLVDLGDRAAALRRAVRGRGWDLVRPASGQALLGRAMVPGPAHRRLPRSLFFPFPHASADPVPEPLPVS